MSIERKEKTNSTHRKKPTASKATGADRPTSAKPTSTTGTKTTTTKSTTTTTKAATSKTTADATKTTATTVPATPKTPKPPTTPKTPKPPATPKAPTTPKTKPATSRPATARPATATTKPTSTTTSKPVATATKRPATASATSTTKAAATTTKPGPASSRPATARPATAKATTTTTKATKTTTSTTAKPAASKATTTKAAPATSRPATATVSPREPAASGSASARPSTSSSSSASVHPLMKSTSGSKSTPTPSAGTTKKATTPRGTTAKSPRDAPATDVSYRTRKAKDLAATRAADRLLKAALTDVSNKLPRNPKQTSPKLSDVNQHRPVIKKIKLPSVGLPLKSPRSEAQQKSPRKSPRHNIQLTSTAPDLLAQDPARHHLTAGSRSVSVGGLQSNITRAAPTGRRKPTVNPVKSRKDTPIREQPVGSPQSQRAAAGFLNGMGLLASVGGEGQEFGQVQLRKVSEDKPKPLLIRVKGRRNVTARAVETSCKSLNKGDAFVLIDPSSRTNVFEWRGALANRMEVAKAMDIAGRVKNKEFGGRADMFVLEDSKTDQNPNFWELLGGKSAIAAPDSAGDDEDEDKIVRQDYLFGIAEKTPGKPELYQVAKSKFYKEMLQSGQVYLLDCLTELYMWVGKGCANTHRTLIASKAQEAMTLVKVRPKWVGITRVIEGAEPEIFKEKFADWPSTLPITMAAVPKGNVAAKLAVKFEVASLFASPKRDDRNIDDGTGKIEIWRVKDHAKEPVDPNMYGQFFDSESYVILYKYMIKNREVYIIYFWQGKKSSIHEKGSSALLTIDLDDSIGGNATQIRVVQNKEPKHFMKLFKGFIIVHKACETEDGASAVPETALYQIRGCNLVANSGCDTRAVQLDTPNVKYLNTNDIFLLNTAEKQFIWLGANSCKFLVVSQEVLVQLGNTIKGSREQVFIREGEEPSEFWENMGEGKWMPRLFHCSSASGAFKVEEVLEWDQEDLDPGHHHILDTSTDVYLWTGPRSVNVEEEKKLSLQAALDYTRLYPARASLTSPDNVLSVVGYKEPYAFTSVFHGWDYSRARSNGENDVIRVEDLLKDLTRNYTLSELRNYPKMLDSSKLESYLSTEEFASVFKMDKEAFAVQPLWKREQQKKNVGLY